MANAILDALVDYPAKALQKIGTDATIVKLLTNNPNIDMDSDEADAVFDRYLFDYEYVDDTTDEAAAYICVETELARVPTPTIKDMKIYVKIVCHKRFMEIDPSKFKATIGNRRDNLSRYVDKLLSGSDIFGIGALTLDYARIVSAPTGFTARELGYSISDFKVRRGQ